MALVRTTGQLPALPGAVVAGGLIFTSGVVSPTVLAGLNSEVAVSQQISEMLAELLRILADAGAGPGDVVRIEAFLASADDFPEWNRQYAEIWPVPGPARTTLVTGFARSDLLAEVQAVAAVGSARA